MKSDPKDKCILIVDDDETVMEFLKFTVEKEGFKTITALDGLTAIDKVTSEKPDLVILDMMIPKKSGFEIIKTLQSIYTKDIPIIVITGKFADDNLRNMIQNEPNVKDYILKPVKPAYLLYKIHSILGTMSSEEKAIEEKKKELQEKLAPKIIDEQQ